MAFQAARAYGESGWPMRHRPNAVSGSLSSIAASIARRKSALRIASSSPGLEQSLGVLLSSLALGAFPSAIAMYRSTVRCVSVGTCLAQYEAHETRLPASPDDTRSFNSLNRRPAEMR